MKEIERFFRPEFINRLDDVIVFRPLTRDDLVQIVEYEVAKVASGWPSRASSWSSRRRQGLPDREGVQPRLRRPAAASRDRTVHRGPAQRAAASARR
jgi:hypothetical protein